MEIELNQLKVTIVLEIGPGSTPYWRADEYLEYEFNDDKLIVAQRGDVKDRPEFGTKKVHYYTGDTFPFEDNQFDYVIVSHVIEHVKNPEKFMDEVFRVGGGRGYLEFPLPTYEYLYDFDVHLNMVWWDSSKNIVFFVPKDVLEIKKYSPVTSGLRRSLELGWDELISANKNYFFCGFEFSSPLLLCKQHDLSKFQLDFKSNGHTIKRRIFKKIFDYL